MQISVSKQIHADLAHQHGFLGEGIGIAYLDTGLFPHKDFSPHSTRIAKFVDFVHSKSFSYDDNGHGTHITGIAASSATFGSDYLGIAPKSHIVSLKVQETVFKAPSYRVLTGFMSIIAPIRSVSLTSQ
mgnify:CR=1 FL=1